MRGKTDLDMQMALIEGSMSTFLSGLNQPQACGPARYVIRWRDAHQCHQAS